MRKRYMNILPWRVSHMEKWTTLEKISPLVNGIGIEEKSFNGDTKKQLTEHVLYCEKFYFHFLCLREEEKGTVSAILTKCTRDEGFIPINKNLWSLSFVTTLSCFSFLLLSLMFYVIDVRHWWGGQPFIYPGMNSIFVYVGHALLAMYFPFNWEVKDSKFHFELLAQDLLGTSIWVLVAYLLYRQKFFLKI